MGQLSRREMSGTEAGLSRRHGLASADKKRQEKSRRRGLGRL